MSQLIKDGEAAELNRVVKHIHSSATEGGQSLGPISEFTALNNLDIGAYKLSANQFGSTVSTGTAPLVVASTTKVTNLNADLLDGKDQSAFATLAENETIDGSWSFTDNVKLSSTKKFYLDGGSDSYIYESAADDVALVSGGVTVFEAVPTSLILGSNISLMLQPTKKLYFGLGNNTYIYESSANVMDLVADALLRIRLSVTGTAITGDLDVSDDVRIVNDLTADGNITFNTNGSTKLLYLDTGAHSPYITANANGRISIFADMTGGTDGLHVDFDAVSPTSDNTLSSGKSVLRWTEVWAVDGSINTSDGRQKEKIEESDLGLDFILDLNPVSFKRKDYTQIKEVPVFEEIKEENGKTKNVHVGTKKVEELKTYKRRHYGLVAQEVKEALKDKDFAGFIHDKETDSYGLRYEEFIGPLIKAVQEQQEVIQEQQKEIDQLKKRIDKLK